MRIEDLRTEHNNQRQRIAATIIWEEREHPAQLVYYEVPEARAAGLAASADAFLLTVFPLAVRYGERRICIEQPVCPRLRDGVQTMMAVFHTRDRKPPVALE